MPDPSHPPLRLPAPLAAAIRDCGAPLIVTGAGGWIGRASLDALYHCLGPDDFARRVIPFAATDRAIDLRNGARLAASALARLDGLETPARPIIFHYAFLTREKAAQLGLGAYVAANAAITAPVARAVRRLRPRGFFLTSAGAVYTADGGIDTDLAGNPYGVLKARDEQVFLQACGDADCAFVAARVFNLSGEYANKIGSYVLSSLISDALAGRPLTLRARHRVIRSYVHVGDLIAAGLGAVIDGDGRVAIFDTAGAETVEIGELADHVRVVLGREDLAVERAIDATAPADRYVGDGTAMAAIAAAHGIGLIPLAGQIRRTAQYLAVLQGSEGQ